MQTFAKKMTEKYMERAETEKMEIIKHNTPDITNPKIAGFDFDNTLVCPKGDTTFCRKRDDWKLLFSNTRDVLTKYHKDGYTVVIVTYQSKKYKREMIKDFANTFDIPLYIIIGDKDTKKDFDIIDYLELPKGTSALDQDSFYCGDANGKKNGAWSDIDLVFAERNNLKFYLPGHLFNDNDKTDDCPLESLSLEDNTDLDTLDNYDVVVMCGSQGSGKSTFVRKELVPRGFEVISGDEYKSNKAKMLKVLKTMISEGKRVVIDSTNATLQNREHWNCGSKTITIHIDTPKQVAMERNSKRTTGKVPAVAIHKWFKNFDPTDIGIVVKTT